MSGTRPWTVDYSQGLGPIAAPKVPPAKVTGVRLVSRTVNSVTLAWDKPLTGTAPFTYRVLYVQDGAKQWFLGLTTVSNTMGVLPLPKRGTGYSVCITASN